jgi:hypothetical protein
MADPGPERGRDAGRPVEFHSGVRRGVDAQGHILVLHRGAHPIMEFDSNGKFVRSRGDVQRGQDRRHRAG